MGESWENVYCSASVCCVHHIWGIVEVLKHICALPVWGGHGQRGNVCVWLHVQSAACAMHRADDMREWLRVKTSEVALQLNEAQHYHGDHTLLSSPCQTPGSQAIMFACCSGRPEPTLALTRMFEDRVALSLDWRSGERGCVVKEGHYLGTFHTSCWCNTEWEGLWFELLWYIIIHTVFSGAVKWANWQLLGT